MRVYDLKSRSCVLNILSPSCVKLDIAGHTVPRLVSVSPDEPVTGHLARRLTYLVVSRDYV